MVWAEIDMGEWDGHSFDEIREQFPAEYVARGQICTISDRRRERVLQIVQGAQDNLE